MIPPADAEPTRGASIAHYRVEERLGAGGMGAVYRGYDEKLHRSVALKRLLPSVPGETLSLRFRREARMAARLNHPSIVHIYEIVEAAGAEWIVMELVQGKTLDRLLREGRLELTRALRWAREIADGLSEAHAQGIVHRDLKAANVMVTQGGRVKILDFGLAKMYEADADQDISAPGAVIGTCHAMSPEQAQGLAVDHRSDLFSLGSLLYEMLTGMSPFQAASPTQTLARICAHTPTPITTLLPSLPRDVGALVQRLLEKPVDRRLQTATEVVTILERLERSGVLEATPSEAPPTRIDTRRDLDTVAPMPRATSPSPMSSLERRQLTALCCEMVDVAQAESASSAGFDAETLYELMLRLRPLGEAVAQRYDGTVGSVMGPRLLIYFGHPSAHEDDAWRAVRAGLDLVTDAAEQLAEEAGGGNAVALRVGIHTGTAVVSSSRQAAEPVVLGPMLDVVLRLLASAGPGTVVMSAGTRALVHRGVAVEDCAPLPPAPGTPEPLRSFVVRAGQDSGDERLYEGMPLVGRDRELESLLAQWEQARSGTGQAVLVSGEPGMGKSRLLGALRERLQLASSPRWVTAQGSPYTQNTPLLLGLQLLQRATAAAPGATVSEQLAAALEALSLSEACPLLAALLGLPAEAHGPLAPMPPERQREETLDALAALVFAMAERDPLVLVVEDLHWFDATSIAWLDRLIEHVSTAPLLLLMTMRPGVSDVSWSSRAHVTQLALAPLAPDDTARLVELLTGEQSLRPDVRQHILDKTDGVPLFIEELTRSVLEGVESGEWRSLPTSLRDSLTVRLDRLGPAREVAQLASVIGRTFSLPLLAAISVHDMDTLERELRRLVQSGLVHRRGFGAQARYAFKHALVRDAAYDSLLKRERQHLHLQVAHALQAQPVEQGAAPPELLAHHFAEGNRPDMSAACRLDATRQALGRSAYHEALEHVRAGLQTIAGMAAGANRDGLELQLQSARVPAVIALQGFASPEVEQAYLRGLQLCGDDEARFGLLYGLYSFYAVSAKPELALPHAEHMLAIAEARGSAVLSVQSRYALGALSFLHGELAAARQHLAAAMGEHHPSLDTALPQAFGTDDRKASLAYDALASWMQGWTGEARAKGDTAVEAARASGHPFTLTTVLLLTGFLHRFRRDPASLRQHAEEMLALAETHGLFQIRDANVLLGLALATESADVAHGRMHLRRSLEAYQATGFRVFVGFYQVELAGACLQHGELAGAEEALLEAWATFGEGSERFWEPELHRVQGELHAMQGRMEAAEASFSSALSIASARGATALELRAATSLARLQQASGREPLAAALARMPQDTATADRLDAEALLAAMG